MSQIKQLQPKEGVTLLAVKVPECAMLPYVHRNRLLFDLPKCECDMIKLPEGNWQLLGKSTGIPESVWQTLVKKQGDSYKNYSDKLGTWFSTATESAMSFLAKHEVYSVNPYPYPTYHPEDNLELHDWHLDNWKRFESKAGTWLFLLKIQHEKLRRN